MKEQRKYTIEQIREHLYLLAIHFEQQGNKPWSSIIDQARDYLLELEQLKESKK